VLIVIRGASGSGKSTLAAQVQQQLGWPTAVLGQDHFRRTIYKERQDAGHADGTEHVGLLEVRSEALPRGWPRRRSGTYFPIGSLRNDAEAHFKRVI